MYDIQDGKCILYSEVLRRCGSIKLSKNVFIYTQKTSTSIQPGTRCCGICSARISGLGPEVWHPCIHPSKPVYSVYLSPSYSPLSLTCPSNRSSHLESLSFSPHIPPLCLSIFPAPRCFSLFTKAASCEHLVNTEHTLPPVPPFAAEAKISLKNKKLVKQDTPEESKG